MKKHVLRFVVLGGAVLVACQDPMLPPAACGGPLLDREVYTGQRETVAVCFTDPDGGQVTLSAASSDEGVVAVIGAQPGSVELEGRGIGTASITVTATDPDGETGSASFAVEVPNREPASMDIPPLQMSDSTAELTLTDYFSDPDGQPLDFSATSSDPSIVSATVLDRILALRAERSGSAVVRVIALLGTPEYGGVHRSRTES